MSALLRTSGQVPGVRRQWRVRNRDAAIPRQFAQTGIVLGRSGHSDLSRNFGIQQCPFLRTLPHHSVDDLLVFDLVSQRKTPREEPRDARRSSMTSVKSA
jgi:hypothetical protein